MKRRALYFVAVATFVVSTAVQSADFFAHRFNFVGLWEAIDPLDGFRAEMSITPAGQNTYKILNKSEYYSFCASDDPAQDGVGTTRGTGYIQDGVVVSDDRHIDCANGDTIEAQAKLIPDVEHDLLIVDLLGKREEIVFHRISSSDRSFKGWW